MFKNVLFAVIFAAASLACPWGKCAIAQDSSQAPTQESASEGAAAPATRPDLGPVLPKIIGDFRSMRMTGAKARVTDIIDGVTIETDDKTKVRLTGIWVPWESDADPGATVRKAMELLKKVAMGRYVRFYQTKEEGAGRANRLGQTLAQVERDDGLWLQGVLLYAGMATVMTSESNPEMAERMYTIEQDARNRKVGLWADKRWNVLNPGQAKDFANEYRIVEGKVFSTAMRNNVFYINFSRDWKTDFTVSVASDKRMAFAKQGINLMGLNGKRIRVRGWVRNYNGPLIEITHPQQIEVLD